MYSSEILVTPVSVTPKPGWLDSVPPSMKLPLGFLMGAILGLSTPGFDQSYLAWFGLVPLLILVRACRSRPQAFLTGFAFGAGYYAISLSFFTGMYPLRWMGLNEILGLQVVGLSWLIETCHYALLLGLFALFTFSLPLRPSYLPWHRRPFYPYLLAIPSVWVFLQWVVAPSPFFMGTPLTQLAYTQSHNLPLIQLAALGGSALIDFIIVMVNTALAQLVIEMTRLTTRLGERVDGLNAKVGASADLGVALLLIALALSWGSHHLSHVEESVRPERALRLNPQTPPIAVTVVQGSVSIEEERFKTVSDDELSRRYQNLATGSGSTLVVLPEGVVTLRQMAPGGLLEALKKIEKNERKEVIYGAVEPMQEGYINVARLLSPFPFPEKAYVKQRLVPFGETIPVNLIYQRIPEELRSKLPASSERFLAAQRPQLIKSGWGKIGVAICNEVIYPKLVSEQVRKGASLLVVMANLGWFHQSSLNKQFLACATLRAVENNRFLILATNTGISAVIDPAGVVVSKSFALKRGVLIDTVQFIYLKTPFNRIHWL